MIVKISNTLYIDFNTVASVYFYEKEENTELHSFSIKYTSGDNALTYRISKEQLDAFVARMDEFCDMSEAHLDIYRMDLKSSKLVAQGKFEQVSDEYAKMIASKIKAADTNPEPTVN